MSDKDLMDALKQMSRDDCRSCLGCGHEHSCSVHGCAVLDAAAKRIRALLVEITVLRLERLKLRTLCEGVVRALPDQSDKFDVPNLDTK